MTETCALNILYDGYGQDNETYPYVLAELKGGATPAQHELLVGVFDSAAKDFGMKSGVRIFTSQNSQTRMGEETIDPFVYMSFDELAETVPSSTQMRVLATRIAHDFRKLGL